MEIKHTIEILTKDIQDIEKLVGNLQNSQDGSAIELDLALSKLRNVYEILTLIKTDRLHGFLHPEQAAIFESVPEPKTVMPKEPEASSEPAAVPEAIGISDSKEVPEPDAGTEPAIKPEPVAEPEPVAAPEPVAEPEPVAVPEPVAEPEPVKASKAAPKKHKDAEIIAEKFSSESSINENLAGQREKDLDAKVMGQPIDQISRNIGINDRFLIIRELFEGNSDEFGKLISGLDGAESYQAALELLNDRFAGSMDHDGVEILTGLVKRRFLQV